MRFFRGIDRQTEISRTRSHQPDEKGKWLKWTKNAKASWWE